MFEHRNSPVISFPKFLFRLLKGFSVVLLLAGISLLLGMYGYHFLEELSWTDSFLNASMILGGMGPVNELHSEAGKIFAGAYALYSGLILIGITGIFLVPVIHRVMHRMHHSPQNGGRRYSNHNGNFKRRSRNPNYSTKGPNIRGNVREV